MHLHFKGFHGAYCLSFNSRVPRINISTCLTAVIEFWTIFSVLSVPNLKLISNKHRYWRGKIVKSKFGLINTYTFDLIWIDTTFFLVICQQKSGSVLESYDGFESRVLKPGSDTSPIRRRVIGVTFNWPTQINEFKGTNEPTLCDVESPIWVISSSKADWASIDLLPVLWKKKKNIWTGIFKLSWYYKSSTCYSAFDECQWSEVIKRTRLREKK